MKHITTNGLDLASMVATAQRATAGAVVLFSGEVRNLNAGKAVAKLEYDAFAELAEKTISDILMEARNKWKLEHAGCIHRIGTLAIGESAVVVVTSSAHRNEAYAANKYIIDKVKHQAPIWKCEHYLDGSKEWGSNCACGEAHFHIHQ